MKKTKANKIHIKGIRSFGKMLCILIFAAIMAGSAFSFARFPYAVAGAELTQVNEFGFAKGDGSEQNPFIITTPSQLDNMRNYLSKDNPDYSEDKVIPLAGGKTPLAEMHDFLDDNEDLPPIEDGGDEVPQFLPYYFALDADIDLGGALEEGGELYGDGNGWQPIGSVETYQDYFYGILDGRGHSIRNLWVKRPEAEYVGLFGAAFGMTVKDLRLVLDDRGINGKTNAGGIVGSIEYNIAGISTIKDCFVTGKIKTAGQDPNECAGGFAGEAIALSINNSYFEGTLESAGYIGGLSGSAYKTAAKNCYVKASAINTPDGAVIGGIFGYAANWGINNAVISNNQISECFIDLTSGIGADAFAAEVSHKFNVAFSYYAVRERITADSAKYDTNSVAALDAAQQNSKKAYNGFDFSIWGFDKNDNLILRTFGEAYDPSVPPDLTWLYITLPCLLFAAAVIITAIMLYRRKKTLLVTETVIERIEIVKELLPIKKPLPKDLSKQERRIAELVLKGKSMREISEELNLSKGAVSTYASRIYIKAGVDGQKAFLTYYLGNDE